MTQLVQLMKSHPRCEPPIPDSSMLSEFKKCERKYFYRYILGRVPKNEPVYFRFGSAYHKFREVLENTKSVAVAMADAQEYFRKAGGDPRTGDYYEYLTEYRLLQSCKEGYRHWQLEKKQGAITVIATEAPFNLTLPDGHQRSGRKDQTLLWSGDIWSRDFKCTTTMGKNYTKTLAPNDQFSGYCYHDNILAGCDISDEQVAVLAAKGIMVEVLYNTKTHGPEIKTYLATRTVSELRSWLRDTMFRMMWLDSCRENDIWPMNEQSCYMCAYHKVCTQPSESAMLRELENDYVVKVWDNQLEEV